MRNRIRLFGGKKTEIFHLDIQVGAIAFIPVLNVIYYLSLIHISEPTRRS